MYVKKILSVSDVKKLKAGDQLSDHLELALGKTYTIENISYGLVYAIYDNGSLELKIFKSDEIPETPWWVHPEQGEINNLNVDAPSNRQEVRRGKLPT